MMKKQKITVGAILEIDIDNQYYVYAQIIEKGGYAFFDYQSKNHLKDFTALQQVPILFIVGVYNDVVTKGHWVKVGKLELRPDLKVQPMQYIQDPLHLSHFELYNPNTGEMTPCGKEECEGLEYAAIWEAVHVESRIRDYYNGVSNVWVEQMRIKL